MSDTLWRLLLLRLLRELPGEVPGILTLPRVGLYFKEQLHKYSSLSDLHVQQVTRLFYIFFMTVLPEIDEGLR